MISKPQARPQIGGLYILTLKGVLATLPHGECGHIICASRDRCAFLPPDEEV